MLCSPSLLSTFLYDLLLPQLQLLQSFNLHAPAAFTACLLPLGHDRPEQLLSEIWCFLIFFFSFSFFSFQTCSSHPPSLLRSLSPALLALCFSLGLLFFPSPPTSSCSSPWSAAIYPFRLSLLYILALFRHFLVCIDSLRSSFCASLRPCATSNDPSTHACFARFLDPPALPLELLPCHSRQLCYDLLRLLYEPDLKFAAARIRIISLPLPLLLSHWFLCGLQTAFFFTLGYSSRRLFPAPFLRLETRPMIPRFRC